MRRRAKARRSKRIAKKANSASRIRKSDYYDPSGSPVDQILHLQRTIGNQRLQRFFQSDVIQEKPRIGQPGGIYEQEADQVAEKVIKMHEAQLQRQAGEKNDEEILQNKKSKGQTVEVTPDAETRIQSLRNRGQPLPRSSRNYFESRFSHNFSGVRLHTDSQALKTARALNAKAFTVGKDIMFGDGQYSPDTLAGRYLIAHELTHVVQQSRANKNQHRQFCNCSFLQLKPDTPRAIARRKTTNKIKIATITFRRGDTRRSVMLRALMSRFKLSRKRAQNIIRERIVRIETWGWRGIKAGTPISVYLSLQRIKTIEKMIKSYIEAERKIKGKRRKQGKGRKGFINVPSWLAGALRIINTVITIGSVVAGGAALIIGLKALWKKTGLWLTTKFGPKLAKLFGRGATRHLSARAARKAFKQASAKLGKRMKFMEQSLTKTLRGDWKRKPYETLKKAESKIKEIVSKAKFEAEKIRVGRSIALRKEMGNLTKSQRLELANRYIERIKRLARGAKKIAHERYIRYGAKIPSKGSRWGKGIPSRSIKHRGYGEGWHKW